VADRRELSADPARGPRRVLVALYAIFALAATSRGIVQIATKFGTAPLAYVLSLAAGLIYILATVGLLSRQPWSRPLAWFAVSTELLGVLVVGTLSILDSAAFPRDTVWSRFGSGYGYVPLILPALGLLFLYKTTARQLATQAHADEVTR
jgi:hypothetical protein